jgi:AcrR family transcriptional regulator
MGIAERKERERRQRMKLILDAAEEVFLDKGLKNATIDEIAENAELSKGTIYLYFRSKELIFTGIELRGTKILAEYFSRAADSQKVGIDKVRAIGQAYYNFSQDYPCYFSAMSKFEDVDPAWVAEMQDEPIIQECHRSGMKVLEILAEAIRCGIADDSIRKDIDPDKMAVFLWAISNGVIQMHLHRATHISMIKGFSPDFLVEELDRHMAAILRPITQQ